MAKGAAGRRARGTAPTAVPIYVEVSPEAKAVLDRVARSKNVQKWVVMENCLLRLAAELDADGHPTWWPETRSTQDELPLPQSA